MGPWTCWAHAQYSYVNQTHDIETLKNRGGGQGDTQGPLGACADLPVQAREVRNAIHSKQH
eukprot:6095655-Lingulodinium_polyedra.AAC.1